MRQLVFAAPGDLATATGGFIYDRRIVEGLRALGWRIEVADLGEGFPFPTAAARERATRRLSAPAGQSIVVDGLALGALPELAAALAARHRLIALVHHPLALESGLSPAAAEALRASERQALASGHRVIVTSAFTGRLLASEYAVAPDRVTVVRPGVDRAERARGGVGPVSLLAVGAASPRKGHDVLVAACAAIRDLAWRLTIVGDLTRDAEAAARLKGDIARFNLGERVLLTGTIPAARLEQLYASADLFALASHFEGYGMAFAEAIAHGLAVVGTTGGAIAETVPAGAGVLAPPGDVGACAAALRRLIGDPDERRRLAAAAWQAANALPTWSEAAEQFSRAVEAD